MNYVGILGAGKGTRMGKTPMPKQFLELGDKQIIIHTIDQFFISEHVDKIIVAVPSDWVDYTINVTNKYYGENDKITIIEGSDERNRSIINVCNYIVQNYEVGDDDIIITHDAVRPFVTQRIIEQNVEAIQANDVAAIDTVVSSADTIVESLNGETITAIPVRHSMYQGQTPQTFYIKDFIQLYKSLSDDEKNVLTDAVKAYVLKDKKVGIVDGDQANFKITTTFDLMLAKTLLKMKKGE